jgi:hypothetical protein
MAVLCVICSREFLSQSVEGLSTSTIAGRILTYLPNSCGWTERIRNTFEVSPNIFHLLMPLCLQSNIFWCPNTAYFQSSHQILLLLLHFGFFLHFYRLILQGYVSSTFPSSDWSDNERGLFLLAEQFKILGRLD